MEDFLSNARLQGVKMTDQRRVIAKVVLSSSDHPDVEMVYDRARVMDQNISLSTVYRTLKIFQEKGLLERHNFGGIKGRYEALAANDHHDHLVDMESGQVIEFFDEEIERLQSKIAQKLGYRLVSHKLELYAVPLKEKNKNA
jgi:Fur family ferric uptake transcriptional regulator